MNTTNIDTITNALFSDDEDDVVVAPAPQAALAPATVEQAPATIVDGDEAYVSEFSDDVLDIVAPKAKPIIVLDEVCSASPLEDRLVIYNKQARVRESGTLQAYQSTFSTLRNACLQMSQESTNLKDKLNSPCLIPADFDGSNRLKTDVKSVSAFIIDLDGVELNIAAALQKRLEDKGIWAWGWTTWSNGSEKKGGPTKCCWRIVIPLSEDVPGSAWGVAWPKLNQYLAVGKSDPATKDATRIHLMPASPSEITWWETKGELFEVGPLVSEAIVEARVAQRKMEEEAAEQIRKQKEVRAARKAAYDNGNTFTYASLDEAMLSNLDWVDDCITNIPADNRNTWLGVAGALKSLIPTRRGQDMFHAWSITSPKFVGESFEKNGYAFATIKSNTPMEGIKTLQGMVKGRWKFSEWAKAHRVEWASEKRTAITSRFKAKPTNNDNRCFDDMDNAKPATALQKERNGNDEWVKELIFKKGESAIAPLTANLVLILENWDAVQGIFALNAMTGRVLVTRKPPWHKKPENGAMEDRYPRDMRDTDATMVKSFFETQEQCSFPNVQDVIDAVAERNTVDPLLNYLNGLKWDGVERLSMWLTTYAGAENNDYTRAVGRSWMIGAVARAFVPGCKMDNTLILEGLQNSAKSKLFKDLAGGEEFFSDSLPEDMGSKDASAAVHSKWIYELGEMASLSKSDVTTIKSFLTREVDVYRPSYGRREVVKPRRCVFCGTTNEDQYFKDTTGNRRFWPVKIGATIDSVGIQLDRDQLWAEAVEAFRRGEQHWITDPVILKLASEECEKRLDKSLKVDEDAWYEIVEQFIEKEVVRCSKVDLVPGFKTYDIAFGALSLDNSKLSKEAQKRIRGIMAKLGYDYKATREVTGKLEKFWVKD